MTVERGKGSWSSAQSIATSNLCKAWSDPQSVATGGKSGSTYDRSRVGQTRRVVRFEGCPDAPDEPAAEQLIVAADAGEKGVPRGYLDSQTHALNAVIALRDAKALAMSLGLPCRFVWPDLWRKDCAIMCSHHVDGAHLGYVGAASMPRMRPRSDANA